VPPASPVLRACLAFAGACLLAFREPVRVGGLDTARLERRPLPPPEPPLPCGARFPPAFVELLFLTPAPRWLPPRARCRLVPPPLPLVRFPLPLLDCAIILFPSPARSALSAHRCAFRRNVAPPGYSWIFVRHFGPQPCCHRSECFLPRERVAIAREVCVGDVSSCVQPY
jgi:hypothetical protein